MEIHSPFVAVLDATERRIRRMESGHSLDVLEFAPPQMCSDVSPEWPVEKHSVIAWFAVALLFCPGISTAQSGKPPVDRIVCRNKMLRLCFRKEAPEGVEHTPQQETCRLSFTLLECPQWCSNTTEHRFLTATGSSRTG